MKLKKGFKAMKLKLTRLGSGMVVAIVSAIGFGSLTTAIICLCKVAQASSYMAVLIFLFAVGLITLAVQVFYRVGACFVNDKK